MMDVFTKWPPSEIEPGWLAGLLEGEGSFYRSKSGQPVISIGMNDEDIIAKVAKMMGVSYHRFQPKVGKINYRLDIKGRARAGRIMGTLHGLMGDRRQKQIENALRFVEPQELIINKITPKTSVDEECSNELQD